VPHNFQSFILIVLWFVVKEQKQLKSVAKFLKTIKQSKVCSAYSVIQITDRQMQAFLVRFPYPLQQIFPSWVTSLPYRHENLKAVILPVFIARRCDFPPYFLSDCSPFISLELSNCRLFVLFFPFLNMNAVERSSPVFIDGSRFSRHSLARVCASPSEREAAGAKGFPLLFNFTFPYASCPSPSLFLSSILFLYSTSFISFLL
jgi:hypothetical protein